jgi:hypothetical protein
VKRNNLVRTDLVEAPASEPQIANLGLNDQEKLQNGLAKLVLVVVELLRQVLERQAVRRLEAGDLTSQEVERLGLAFLQMKTKFKELSDDFGIEKKDIDLTLGSLLRSGNPELDEASLVDVLDTVLQKGLVVGGRLSISVADINLIGLDLLATLYPVTSKNELGR